MSATVYQPFTRCKNCHTAFWGIPDGYWRLLGFGSRACLFRFARVMSPGGKLRGDKRNMAPQLWRAR